MNDLIMTEKVKKILENMNIDYNLQLVNKWNKIDTKLHLAQFFAIGIGATLYFNQDNPLISSLLWGTAVSCAASIVLEKIHNMTNGKFYTFLPGYKKIQQDAVPVMNLWFDVLSNKDNQIEMINFFEKLVSYTYQFATNDKDKFLEQEYFNKIEKLKKLFSENSQDKVKLQLYMLPLLKLHHKVDFELRLNQLKKHGPEVVNSEMEQEIGASRRSKITL